MTKKVKIHVGDFTVSTIGFLIGELAEQELQSDSLAAKMNAELDAVRARYEEKLQNLRGNINIRRETLEQWAELRKELFKEPRSMVFERGTIGFSLSPKWKVETRRGFTWKKVVAAFIARKMDDYLRKKEPDLDKEMVLKDRTAFDTDSQAELGIKFSQEDSFFCEIKKDKPAAPAVSANSARELKSA